MKLAAEVFALLGGGGLLVAAASLPVQQATDQTPLVFSPVEIGLVGVLLGALASALIYVFKNAEANQKAATAAIVAAKDAAAARQSEDHAAVVARLESRLRWFQDHYDKQTSSFEALNARHAEALADIGRESSAALREVAHGLQSIERETQERTRFASQEHQAMIAGQAATVAALERLAERIDRRNEQRPFEGPDRRRPDRHGREPRDPYAPAAPSHEDPR